MKKQTVQKLLDQLEAYGYEITKAQMDLNGAEARLLDARHNVAFAKKRLSESKKNSWWVRNQIVKYKKP